MEHRQSGVTHLCEAQCRLKDQELGQGAKFRSEKHFLFQDTTLTLLAFSEAEWMLAWT